MSEADAVEQQAAGRGYIARSGKSDWRTQADVLELVREAFGGVIDLDPCASSDPARWFATANVTAEEDGLPRDWNGRVFVNPPFEALDVWTAKCAQEHRERGAEVILLLPSRTDTRYWHEHIRSASAICLWRGRMRFVGAPASAPFPTALVYWGWRASAFQRAFQARGMVVAP